MENKMNNSTEGMTMLIAVYGAILSTISFVLSLILGISKLREKKPYIKISFKLGRLIKADGSNSERLIIIDAHNKGVIPVVLTGFGWLAKSNIRYQILKPYLLDLPKKLDPHRRISAYYACRWFQEMENKSEVNGFYFADEEGNNWKVRFLKNQKKIWENSDVDGYLIEWDPKSKIYYVNKN